jgi:hypothetical protein
MLDSQDDVFATLLERYRKLCVERDNAQDNIERMQAHQRELVAQINDCLAAARVFDYSLGADDDSDIGDGPSRPPRSFYTPAAHPRQRTLTVRGLVLAAVEKAHPNSVRAADIHRQLIDRGYSVHEKTVGMTLYRWSLENRVRRDGKMDWYFVPPGFRHSSASELAAPLASQDSAHDCRERSWAE